MNLIGIPIGFYGYAFPGNINLMVIELYRSKKYNLLLVVLILIVVFESIYCTVSLTLLNSLKLGVGFYKTIELIAFGMVFVMGIWMIFENKKDSALAQKSAIRRGMISIVFHPQQVPFWFVMGVFINDYLSLSFRSLGLYQFVACNAIGTLFAMFFYMVLGSRLLIYLNVKNTQINRVMGLLYIFLALYRMALA
jgi:cbb3-type cytochrome oxidase subunit 3